MQMDVYHFQFAAIFQFRFEQLTDTQDCLARFGRVPRHERPYDIFVLGLGGRRFRRGRNHAAGFIFFHGCAWGGRRCLTVLGFINYAFPFLWLTRVAAALVSAWRKRPDAARSVPSMIVRVPTCSAMRRSSSASPS